LSIDMKKIISAVLFVFFVVYLLAAVNQAGAATFTVNTGLDSGPGSLRQAVLAANANNEANIINISQSVKEIYLASPVAIEGDLVVNGSGATIRGSRTHRLFHVLRGAVKFDSFTFRDGYSLLSEDGGAFYIDSSFASVEFVNCTFWRNWAGKSGGAVYIYGTGPGTTIFTSCTITNNEAVENGGGVAVAGGSVRFAASIITGNKTSSDDDIHASGGTVSNTSLFNVIGHTNVHLSFPESFHNDLGVRADEVFKTDSLTKINNVEVMELSGATANKAVDKIPASAALSLPNVDQRGASRPKMAGFDAGAFELDPVALTDVALFGPSYIEVLMSENYTAVVQPEGATLDFRHYVSGLEWEVDNPPDRNVITVDDNGLVSALAVGVAELKVKAHGWNAAGNPVVKEDSQIIRVWPEATEKPTVSVSITKKKTEMAVDEQYMIEAEINVTPEHTPYDLKFESANPIIATVEQATPNSKSALVKARYPSEEVMIIAILTASNSKGDAEPASDAYYLTVTEKRPSKGGGGGCQAGGPLATFLAAALFLVMWKRRA